MITLDTLDSGLITEIESFLRAQIRRTAHPLVSKTTDQLIAEALASVPPIKRTRSHPLPHDLWRVAPDWVVAARRMVRSNTTYEISAQEHIQLIIAIIERWGWSKGKLRTKSGCRCIAGSQLLLLRMGYGTKDTLRSAGLRIQSVLHSRGTSDPYWEWNDQPRRTKREVLDVLREAAR